MTCFARLDPRPADGLLGLLAAFRADPRPEKIDLGVGVYRDETGETPIFAAVRHAEARLATTTPTKAYESPRGNTAFTSALTRLILGASHGLGGVDAFATPGGSGALFLGFRLLQRLSPEGRLFVSEPSWPNHVAMAEAAGLRVVPHAYAPPAAASVDVDALLASLGSAKAGDALLIQGPCHNPTGIDLDDAGWARLGRTLRQQGVLPFVDVAYHGFARSLEADLTGVRALLAAVPEALVAYSCSKNFGLYRDRCGALIVTAETQGIADTVGTHLADIARTSYSMPPAHGAAVVAEILGDAGLRAAWETELDAMRMRVVALRAALADALHPRGNGYDPAALKAQTGMFSLLPLQPGAPAALRERAVYLPASGRINIAGLSSRLIGPAAAALSDYL
jgi:aspartate aminotransferase/aromatic-amino-acid transaminase